MSVEVYRCLIRECTPEAALYEQLAEECVELAHAALKYARAVRAESPTPISQTEALCRFIDESADVAAVMKVVGFEATQSMIEKRLKRWADRL